MALEPGQVVRVRSRQYLVEEVVLPPKHADKTLVRLSCLDDDAQGEPLEVLWEAEVDAEIVNQSNWSRVAQTGFDDPRRFAAYLHTLRWNCVTSTDAKLLQAPYRAGIEVLAYQLEPLRKALSLPRVNLFIADDVGLGKTIEAGLIVRELLMRQKVRRLVVACPPSVVTQWRDELDSRFGLPMVVFDRDYVLRCRRERGYTVNPWSTHSRFIISHALLRDETYAAPLRDWLGKDVPCPGSLLILDEAHNAAPATSSKYAIDSKLTKTVRALAPHFEHRLFLSATPHNGHSNSFSALLEILDPQRFCRGVPIKSAKQLDEVMVRRLKSDLREANTGSFPDRKPVQLDIDGLPENAPELVLAKLLEDYREIREKRLSSAKKSIQAAALLVVTSLQKRLLSSIEAFAVTLAVHRKSLERVQARKQQEHMPDLSLLHQAPGSDDATAELNEEQLQKEEASQLEFATELARGTSTDPVLAAQEKAILDQMSQIAESARRRPDAKVLRLIAWLRENCSHASSGKWNRRRVLIFTEYVDTMRYLRLQLMAAFGETDRAEERFGTFFGGSGSEAKRDDLKRAFNEDPDVHPLRILIATDAAREGVNLQNHCADLFHFDVPWNPSRMEQRNGRIDRKLQRSPEVRCHYFVLVQRPQDEVLKALVKKSARIQKELGSQGQVIEGRLSKMLSTGIRARDAARLVRDIDEVRLQNEEVVEEELEASRERQAKLADQVDRLRKLLDQSKQHLGLDERLLRMALDHSLGMLNAPPLKNAGAGANGNPIFEFPDLLAQKGADASWVETIDTLRKPMPADLRLWDWRREYKPRPVVFRDVGSLDDEVVHLHLEHRVVQRLLGRFLAQGFVHQDLARACVLLTDSPTPRVVLFGRLSLHGPNAARLHDELVAVTAAWTDPATRKANLKVAGRTAEKGTLDLLHQTLSSEVVRTAPEAVTKMLRLGVGTDVDALVPELETRAKELAEDAAKRLGARATKEAADMLDLLKAQQKRIKEVIASQPTQLSLEFSPDERRQLEEEREYQRKRLGLLEKELVSEPERIRKSYQVHATRVEPVGLVYLWPVSG